MTTSSSLREIAIPDRVTVKRLAEIMELPVTTVIGELMKNGIMATINEDIDYETAVIIAEDLGFSPHPDVTVGDDDTLTLEDVLTICEKERESGKNLRSRPPVVTILGHVDHGKTTLLDTIRAASVAASEAGGITQHISAYQVKKRGKFITFIDTPGHAAFAAMRERGASLADIAILIVAADDGIRPQTEEVIAYIKERNIKTIVAINKIDKPTANVAKVKQELAEHGLMIEEWGGDIICNEISAKNNIGIGDLLENILLLAEVEDYRADEERDGLAVVLESHRDPKKGATATVVVKTGTLKVGHDVTVGSTHGRIRRMEDHTGRSVSSAPPSSAVTIYGLNDAPDVNDVVQVVSGKQIARAKARRAEGEVTTKKTEDDIPHLPILIKADVQGSIEAIIQILDTIPKKKIALDIVSTGVGNITESDVKLAQSAGARIYGFNIHATSVARRMAEDRGVTIETYSIIYEVVDAITATLLDNLPDEVIRTDIGTVDVLAIFHKEQQRMIIGGIVDTGELRPNTFARIMRDGTELAVGEITGIKEGAMDTDVITSGKECGIQITTPVRIKKGDVLHVYTQETVEKSLS